MAKIRLTKTELKLQRDAVKRFLRFLPTLELKKKQLIQEIQRVEAAFDEKDRLERELRHSLDTWIKLFSEPVGIEELVFLDRIETGEANVAGVAIPVFVKAYFTVGAYDLERTPLWLDRAIEVVQRLGSLDAERAVLARQKKLIGHELRITIQRINLFEKVKVPEAKDCIRRIQISLGDQQANAVARGKMAKAKLVDVQMESFV